MSNEFLPFCATDTGSNLLTESEYTASSDRTSGNKPGVASAKLNNKALRQANAMASQLAQLVANKTGSDLLDDADYTKLLAQLNAGLTCFTPTFTKYASGSGTHNLTYIFAISSGSATIGATYTNNSITYTVGETVASGLFLRASGSGAPTASGTLTKTAGTGDSTITFRAVRAPLYLRVELGGGGGGGAGGGTGAGTTAGDGGTTSFGTTLLSATGGIKGGLGSPGGAGGTASLGTGPVGKAVSGGTGGGAGGNSTTFQSAGGVGGNSACGGGGGGGSTITPFVGLAGATNTGAGGGGGNGGSSAAAYSGSGGGAGGFVRAQISTVLATYAYAVGAGGTAGGVGTGTNAGAGGAGGSGFVEVYEHYQ